MATKVYLDTTGATVIIDNGTAQVNTINVSEFFFDRNDTTEQVILRDSNDDYKLVVDAADVQDETGTPIGTYQDVIDFLTGLVGIPTDVNVVSVVKAPTSVASTGVTNIPEGATEISIFNNGTGNATVNGVVCPAGVTRTFGFKNPTSAIIVCDGGGTEELIIDYML
jgi:hypothetical protein